jgi:hypothetical protein
VGTCISQDVLAMRRIYKFSLRERQYIQAYHMLHAQWRQQHKQQQQQDTTAGASSDAYLFTPDKIESLIKDSRCTNALLTLIKAFLKLP